ncbi:hypothetical protein NEDG_00130 [Nematocida displodere]|uniref:Uncharacterized protein n=1 Tax=Nematocida displodere TaxID=1805483 RepID=A0A177EI54_9MICR|nr:hypothetical protein NEDG_00130 [Nematocida displodere]
MDVLARVKSILLGLDRMTGRPKERLAHTIRGTEQLEALKQMPGLSPSAVAGISLVSVTYTALVNETLPLSTTSESVAHRVDSLCACIATAKEVLAEPSTSSNPEAAERLGAVLKELLEISEQQASVFLCRLTESPSLDNLATFSRILLQLTRRAIAGLKIRFLGLRRGILAATGKEGPKTAPLDRAQALAEERRLFMLVFAPEGMQKEDEVIFEGFVFSLVRLWFSHLPRSELELLLPHNAPQPPPGLALLKKGLQAYTNPNTPQKRPGTEGPGAPEEQGRGGGKGPAPGLGLFSL